jgi:hypothetical protein
MMDQDNARSIFSVFAASQETFEEAKKKSSEESRKKASFFRFAKDGTYSIRILPLAPVMDKDGNFLPLDRKGYEYPLRSLMLKIENNKKLIKGKPEIHYVTVCNAKYAFKDIEADLIDTYVSTACEQYADDEALCKKLREGSFSGGLKWDSRRCMYIIDLDNVGDGIQILQLSYSQYKDLEERKLNLWGKLNKNGKNVPCPISSIDAAYPVEIIRKTENGKASYSFNIDTVADKHILEETTLQNLLDMPRLPEQIYRYTRYHLEATVAYLTQLDEKFDIDVVNTDAVQNCIAQIKLLLPADDQSHFTLGDKDGDDSDANANDIDSLWKRYDELVAADLDDQTAEGQELRTAILAFIDANGLEVKVGRKKTNEDILNEIEDELAAIADEADEDEEPAKPASKRKPEPEPEADDDEDDDEPETPADEPEDDEDDEPEEQPEHTSRRRSRNDDTNEPAVRGSRRGARPPRRRD